MTDNTRLTPYSELTPHSQQQIRERAYEIYLARGGQEGDEVSDWIAAERDLNESNQPQGK